MVEAVLVCEVLRQADVVVIVVRGELDINSSGVLENAVEQVWTYAVYRLPLAQSGPHGHGQLAWLSSVP